MSCTKSLWGCNKQVELWYNSLLYSVISERANRKILRCYKSSKPQRKKKKKEIAIKKRKSFAELEPVKKNIQKQKTKKTLFGEVLSLLQ